MLRAFFCVKKPSQNHATESRSLLISHKSISCKKDKTNVKHETLCMTAMSINKWLRGSSGAVAGSHVFTYTSWHQFQQKTSKAVSAHGWAHDSQGDSQKETGQRRLWPVHRSCRRLPGSGNIPHRTRNRWMRRASMARLQIPGKDLKKNLKILQITTIQSIFVEILGLGANMVWGCGLPQQQRDRQSHFPLSMPLLRLHQEWQSGTRWRAGIKGHHQLLGKFKNSLGCFNF